MVVRMKQQAQLRSPFPNQAQLIVHIHVLTIEDIVRKRGNSFTVRGEHAPVLAGKKFPRPMCDIDEINSHAQRVRIADDVDI